ncbi:MAG: hypothetical protein EZS28_005582 [Streblomastix strix]|uniref:Uncharacterized protein n=1 Tax=Streblomastix strix TaxID=222440 RepID=A0A5J4WVF8_9EUKA|nr:MAG: hypothetical protein EZS28_005582 [Streblomastix strix]
MSITTESQGENIVCLAPKCKSLYNGNEQNGDTVSLVNRLKGINEKKINLTTNDHIKCLIDGCNINVTTNNLQMKMGVMSMISMEKSALIGIHNMMVVLANGCCAPFIRGDYDDFDVQSFGAEIVSTISMTEMSLSVDSELAWRLCIQLA